jgi:lysylphosphatidylglycerol synthetase-like protein (DUF2156 family)
MSPRRDRAPAPDANVSAISAHTPRHPITDDASRGRSTRLLLVVARVWLPLAIAVAGVALIVIGGPGSHHHSPTIAAAGVALLIAALIVWMINWLFRMSVQSNRDREHEERAREYFDRHGHWPDEAP